MAESPSLKGILCDQMTIVSHPQPTAAGDQLVRFQIEMDHCITASLGLTERRVSRSAGKEQVTPVAVTSLRDTSSNKGRPENKK